MKHIHIVNPYGSIAMERMIYPLTSELPALYNVTTSREVDVTADLNFHCPWHTMSGLEERGAGKHVILYTHCNPPDAPALMDACGRADLITCMTFEGRRELVTMGVDPKKLWVIYAAADQFQYRKRLIGIVGTPQPNARKREHLLLDLVWQYDLTPYQFIFVGEGFDVIVNQLQSLGVTAEAVTVDDNGLRDIYHRLDVLLVTGYVEGGSLPLLEAMASGTKVLSPAFGYAADLLDADCIYEDASDLMDKLNEMMGESILHHRMARSWSWKNYAAEYALLFGRLLSESVDLYPEHGASRYAQLLDIIDEIKPSDIVEIGTWNGNRAIQMIQQAARHTPMDEIFYQGFDLFETQTGEQFRREYSKYGCAKGVVSRRIKATGASANLVEGDTNETVENLMPADLYFVDGGHSERTVKGDAAKVFEMADKNAVVIFDDYYHAGKPEGVGCNVVIDELNLYEFEIEHLPVHTLAEDGRDIGMVKVRLKQNADLRLSMSPATYTSSGTLDDGQPYTTVSTVWLGNAPRSANGDG